jgi:D-alanyl-D-alanine carboxypeptidase
VRAAIAADPAPAVTAPAFDVAQPALAVEAVRTASVRALQPAAWAAPPQLRADGPPPPAITAAATLLLDDASGAVLVHTAGHTPLPPASLTKIATAILTIESQDLDTSVTVDVDSRTMRGSTVMGLVPGDRFTVRDLLYGLMLPSGNDAALALGRQVAGSDADFVARMNALAERLGLTETHFVNAHGLNAPGHLVSAYDLALLTRYAMRLPAFREVAGTQFWETTGSRSMALYNVAAGPLRAVAGADAVKSGFTRQAGRTMVLSATRDGHRLYAVVLNDTQRETDVARLLGWAFTAFEWADEPAAVSTSALSTGG